MRDTEDDPPDAALPPWWCGRCDGTKCTDCATARISLERARRGAHDDRDCDEELARELKRSGRWRADL